jgi:hypothetical protein
VAALGPLTNLATALRRHPELAGKLRGVQVTGGAAHPDVVVAIQTGRAALRARACCPPDTMSMPVEAVTPAGCAGRRGARA